MAFDNDMQGLNINNFGYHTCEAMENVSTQTINNRQNEKFGSQLSIIVVGSRTCPWILKGHFSKSRTVNTAYLRALNPHFGWWSLFNTLIGGLIVFNPTKKGHCLGNTPRENIHLEPDNKRHMLFDQFQQLKAKTVEKRDISENLLPWRLEVFNPRRQILSYQTKSLPIDMDRDANETFGYIFRA